MPEALLAVFHIDVTEYLTTAIALHMRIAELDVDTGVHVVISDVERGATLHHATRPSARSAPPERRTATSFL